MTALTFTITNAGKAEIINAENTGTGPVTITHIALGDALYTPAKTQTTLQHEIKRLDAFGGTVVADDVIHVTITDDSAEQYILGEFGLISDKGTLVGVYAQTTPILEKNPEGIMLLSADMTLTSIDAASITFGPAEFVYPPASLSRAGVVILSNATNSSRQDQAATPQAVKTVNDALTAHKDATSGHTKEQVGLDKLENWSWSHSYTDATGGATKYASGKAVADAFNALNSAKLDKNGTAVNAAKLDNQLPGYYLDWSNFTGVPTQAKRWPSFAEVTGKPATFPPSSHSHPWSEVTDKPAQATRWPNWNEVTEKPELFTPTGEVFADGSGWAVIGSIMTPQGVKPLIKQWGTAYLVATDGVLDVSLPIAYPNTHLNTYAEPVYTAITASIGASYGVHNLTLSGFRIYNEGYASKGTRFWSIGY